MRILVVEDEAQLRAQLQEQLRKEGYAVDVASDGEEALYMGTEYPIDVAIVDLGLPKISGIDVIKRWRSAGKTFPVLILTARGRWQEKVEGLESGADDYLVKPFQLEELLARAKALMRRAAGWSNSLIRCGHISLDIAKQEVLVSEQPIELTAYEYKVLEYLMMRAGQVISKTELTEHIYEQDFERDSNVIEVFIGRLRKKIDQEGAASAIETLRGRGYRFTLPRQAG